MICTEINEPERVEEVLVSHLKENKVYPDTPRLWKIGYSELGGRGMFATRDIGQGELIFVDAPLILGPRCMNKHLPMCACCYKNDCPLFPCDRGCGLPVCSTACENSPRHVDHECRYLRSLGPTSGTDWSTELLQAVTPIRALFMTEQQRMCLSALQCHESLSHGHEIDLLRRNVKNSPSEEDVKLMKRVCGVFNTNSFETVSVQDKDHQTSLRALYPMGALQNHCCVPTTRHHFDEEHRLYVSAAMPIAAGEELTMSYTSLFWDTTLRKQFLTATKHFSCSCKRCSDPSEFGTNVGALLCAADDCSGYLLPRNPLNLETAWVCDKCAKNINHRQVSVQSRVEPQADSLCCPLSCQPFDKICSIRSGLAAIIEEVLHKPPREILKFIRKELSALVPANNYLMMNMKFRIVSYFGRTVGLAWEDLTDGELATKQAYCRDLLSVLDGLNCGDCIKKGIILYELYCANTEEAKRLEKQKRNAEDSTQILPKVDTNENNEIYMKAMDILQNDVVTAALLKGEKGI